MHVETSRSEASRGARALRRALLLPLTAPLAGCNWVVLNPAGDVASQQGHLVVVATVLMLLIIVPVMALTVLFAWKYRSTNAEARYEPDWHHSTEVELAIWAAPLLIIIALGAVTWVGTHMLDPYRSIDRLTEGRAVPTSAKPLEVDVVALDWKWLFIYPEQKIATVNELVLPTDRPLKFRITSASVMNSFYAPALAGQIYAMPGMETKLHAVLNRAGDYTGFSANFSGDGFSHMHFTLHGIAPDAFATWADAVAHGGAGTGTLDHAAYLTLSQPSEKEPVRQFAAVSPDLFDAVVNLCVEPGKMCASQMMMLDAKGGTGIEGAWNVAALIYDKAGRQQLDPVLPGKTAVIDARFIKAYCANNTPTRAASLEVRAPASLAPLQGAGLAWPVGPLSPANATPEHQPGAHLTLAAPRPLS